MYRRKLYTRASDTIEKGNVVSKTGHRKRSGAAGSATANVQSDLAKRGTSKTLDLQPNSGVNLFTVDSQATTEQSSLEWPCKVVSQLNQEWLSIMTVNLGEGLETGLNPVLEPSESENSLIFSTPHNPAPSKMEVVRKADTASHLGLKEPLEPSGLFNQGDPDLSSCVPADDIFKTESDQFLTVDVAELFPDLMDFNEMASNSEENNTKPVDALDLGSVDLLEKSDEEVSPAETDASLDHFFNTYTDLTGFLENLSAETGPSDLADNSAVLAGSDITTTDSTTAPSIGEICASPDDSAETEPTDDESPAKRSCKSTGKSSSRTKQTYRERRDRNNVASRRSRANRKSKYCNMESQITTLESDNEHLRKKIEELQKIAEMSRARLVEALSKK